MLRTKISGCVCVCVCCGGGERVCVCVCVFCEWESEREREVDGKKHNLLQGQCYSWILSSYPVINADWNWSKNWKTLSLSLSLSHYQTHSHTLLLSLSYTHIHTLSLFLNIDYLGSNWLQWSIKICYRPTWRSLQLDRNRLLLITKTQNQKTRNVHF